MLPTSTYPANILENGSDFKKKGKINETKTKEKR